MAAVDRNVLGSPPRAALHRHAGAGGVDEAIELARRFGGGARRRS
jgi:hypothetical protein